MTLYDRNVHIIIIYKVLAKMTFTSGRFRFVAPSNARYEREAWSLVPMPMRNESPAFDVTTPMTLSPRAGMYYKKQHCYSTERYSTVIC